MTRNYALLFLAPACILLVALVNSGVAVAETSSLRADGDMPCAAKAYYVAKNGDDGNNGTEDYPWKTIGKAAAAISAGETAYVKEGVYNEKISVSNSGTPGAYVTIAAYPGHNVTIDGAGIAMPGGWDGLVRISQTKSYIRISGFRIVNSAWAGILVVANGGLWSNIIIDNNTIVNSAASGICAQGPGDNVTIDNNELLYPCNGDSSVLAQESLTVSKDVADVDVKNNLLCYGGDRTGQGGEGIDLKDGIKRGKIHHNVVHDMPHIGIYCDGWDAWQSDIEIFANTVYNINSSGIGIVSESGGTLEKVRAYNNVVYNCSEQGISIDMYLSGVVRDVEVVNNVLYKNGWDWGGGISAGEGVLPVESLLVRNNILSQNKNWQIGLSKNNGSVTNYTIDHNLLDGYLGDDYDMDNVKGTDYIIAVPGFRDPANGNFHLNGTSPAIDAGSPDKAPTSDRDGVSRPQGGGFDIGAFEHAGQGVAEPAIPTALLAAPCILVIAAWSFPKRQNRLCR